jgi:NDP-sugar pyrophosphorylase family protein
MTCLILAGGKGTRLGQLCGELPKPLMPVAQRPFLEYLIVQARDQGFNRMVLCVGHKARVVEDYFGNGRRWGVRIAYSEEKEPLGTGGALREGAKLIRAPVFIAMNGDSYLDSDFLGLLAFHARASSRATVALAQVRNTRRFGRVEVDTEGRIARFREKDGAGPGLINAGVYVFDRSVVEQFPVGVVSLEHEVLPALVGHGLYGMISQGRFVDMGTPDDYRHLIRHPEILPAIPKITGSGDSDADSKQSSFAY